MWKTISTDSLLEIYQTQKPNPAAVLSLLNIDDESQLSTEEMKMYTFLKRYIRSLYEKCADFLKYVTKSTTIVVKKITITFFKTNSSDRNPIHVGQYWNYRVLDMQHSTHLKEQWTTTWTILSTQNY